MSAAKPKQPTFDHMAGAVKLYVAAPARADLGRIRQLRSWNNVMRVTPQGQAAVRRAT